MAAFVESFLQNASWLGHLECFCYLTWQHLQEVSYKMPRNCTIWNASVTWHGSICRKFPTKYLVIVPSGMLLTRHGSICKKFPTKCVVVWPAWMFFIWHALTKWIVIGPSVLLLTWQFSWSCIGLMLHWRNLIFNVPKRYWLFLRTLQEIPYACLQEVKVYLL